jgi:outer membrane protein TolC
MFFRNQFRYVLILSVLLSARLAGAVERLTLSQCLGNAFAADRTLKSAALQIKSAEEQQGANAAQRWPSLALTSGYTRIGEISSFSFPMNGRMTTLQFGTHNRVTLDLRSQMPLFTWWKLSNSIALAEQNTASSRLQAGQSRTALTDQVLRAFYAVLLNQAILNILHTNIERASRYAEISRRRFEAGQLSKLELLRAEVQLKNEQNGLQSAQGNLDKSIIYLAKTVGHPDSIIFAEGRLEPDAVQMDEAGIISRALQHRNDLLQLQLRRQISSRQAELVASADKPSVFMFAGYNVSNGFNPMQPDQFIDNWNVGVQISWPLFDGFATRRNVQTARINQQVAALQEEELAGLITMQIRQALVGIRQAESSIASQTGNLALAEEALKLAQTQFENGFSSSLELLDAQKALAQIELARVQAIFNHLMARIDLCRAMGNYEMFGEDLQKDQERINERR